MTNIVEVDPGKKRAADVENILRQVVEAALADMGVEVGGFALTVWNMGGRCHTSYLADYGLVHRGLVPTLVHDALQRHITVNTVEEGQPTDTIHPA